MPANTLGAFSERFSGKVPALFFDLAGKERLSYITPSIITVMRKKYSGFLELTKERYSCRAFNRRPVSSEKVRKILEAARLAPTAKNLQPVHVWVVSSEEALEKLHGIHPLFGAPVVFMVGCKKEEAWVRGCDGKNGAETDAAIVGTHIMLEAADQGLGCTWVGSFDPAKIAGAFPGTAGYEITALFAVGHPSPAGGPSERHGVRKSIEEFATEL